MEQLKKLCAKIVELSDNLITSLSEAVSTLFSKHENLEVVCWIQYRPLFNDGEPCHFNINHIGFLTKDQVEKGMEENEDIYDWYDETEVDIIKDLAIFELLLIPLLPYLESQFGNAKIIARRGKDELEIQDYLDHG